MSSKTEVTIQATSAAPFTLTIDSVQRPRGQWRYALTTPDGTTTNDAGVFEGVDVDVLALYALATALTSIPTGSVVNIRSTSSAVAQMGSRLTKPKAVPELPFLPFTADRGRAWAYVLPLLAGYTVSWSSILRNDAGVLALERNVANSR